MELLIFLLLMAGEIGLAVLTCTKFKGEPVWHRNRLITSGAELLIVVIAAVFPAWGQHWRFAGCIAVIGVRVVIGLIFFLINRKKNVEKTKGAAIANAVLGVIVVGVSCVPLAFFTGYDGLPNSGAYKVKETEAILVDSSRLEKNETDGSNREVPVHFYYPDGDVSGCPFVLFAHGSFGYYQSNSSLYTELASNGYVVASIDHPYYAFFTEDTSGNTIIVDFDFMQLAVDMTNGVIDEKDCVAHTREWLEVRAADENFVLDSIIAAQSAGALGDEWFTKSDKKRDEVLKVINMTDMTKIGLTGHSIGGAAAIKLGRERDDITAVVDIDGTMFSEKLAADGDEYVFIEEPYPVPFLTLNNTSNYDVVFSKDYKDEKGRPYIDIYVLDNAVDGREMHIENTGHMDFTDLPLLSPVLASMFGRGTVDPKTTIPGINAVILNYFNYYLKGEGEVTVPAWQGL